MQQQFQMAHPMQQRMGGLQTQQLNPFSDAGDWAKKYAMHQGVQAARNAAHDQIGMMQLVQKPKIPPIPK